MSTMTVYSCQFCKCVLHCELGTRDINWVTINHKPPGWNRRFGDKAESYHFCNKCYKEFLTIIHKRASDGVCGICRFAYCCDEKDDSDCEHVDEPPKKIGWIGRVFRITI